MSERNNNERPVNLVKLVAEELIESVIERMGLENTEANREDVLALTLNSLPTKYITTAKGKSYTELINVYRLQYETDVIAALTRASIKVKEKPRSTN